jgi:hypothetical protein
MIAEFLTCCRQQFRIGEKTHEKKQNFRLITDTIHRQNMPVCEGRIDPNVKRKKFLIA